ncbi:MAG: ribonuclease P protein component [Alphaproteobacteria bacterium]
MPAAIALTRRPEFLAVASKGKKWVGTGLILQALRRSDPMLDKAAIRFGLTASRRVGGAVQRNRARRRLRALAREVLPSLGQPGCDYVLIARPATVARPFRDLRGDLEKALCYLHQKA